MYFDYDEKAAYEQRRLHNHISHSKNNSYDSNLSHASSSASLSGSKYSSKNPPPYTTLPSSYDFKPLPRLPTGAEHHVRFIVEKPLPPLPSEILELKGVGGQEDTQSSWAKKRLEMRKEEWAVFRDMAKE